MKGPEILFQLYKGAVFEKNVDAFVDLFDENVLVFDMWQQWTYEGLLAWRHMVKGWFNSLGADRDVVTFEDINIEDNDELAAITAIARFAAVSEKGEELRYLQNRLTWVARKKEGVWKIFHQHTSSPIDFETMKTILTK
jgi:ketosteroid isomerase-like protein